jgi:DNA-directed RNA polymerase specialized sigma24 family protein
MEFLLLHLPSGLKAEGEDLLYKHVEGLLFDMSNRIAWYRSDNACGYEDLVHSFILALFEGKKTLRDFHYGHGSGSTFKRYLSIVFKNYILDQGRAAGADKRRFHLAKLADPLDKVNWADSIISLFDMETAYLLVNSFAGGNKDVVAVFRLLYIQGHSVAEAAVSGGLSIGKVYRMNAMIIRLLKDRRSLLYPN